MKTLSLSSCLETRFSAIPLGAGQPQAALIGGDGFGRWGRLIGRRNGCREHPRQGELIRIGLA